MKTRDFQKYTIYEDNERRADAIRVKHDELKTQRAHLPQQHCLTLQNHSRLASSDKNTQPNH